jgi:uncharacterized membrane protein
VITSARERVALTGLLAGAGLLHLARPALFRSMVPAPLPRKHELVLVSGVVEIVAAGLLVHPRTRRAGGGVAVGLFAAVWPANVQMSIDAVRRRKPWWYTLGTVVRLRLQVPLLRAAARLARGR